MKYFTFNLFIRFTFYDQRTAALGCNKSLDDFFFLGKTVFTHQMPMLNDRLVMKNGSLRYQNWSRQCLDTVNTKATKENIWVWISSLGKMCKSTVCTFKANYSSTFIPSHYLFHRHLNALQWETSFLYFFATFCYLFTVFSGRTFFKNHTGNFLVGWG